MSRDAVPDVGAVPGLAGVAGRTLIVNLPGSTGGARDGLAVLGPILAHAVDQIARRRPLAIGPAPGVAGDHERLARCGIGWRGDASSATGPATSRAPARRRCLGRSRAGLPTTPAGPPCCRASTLPLADCDGMTLAADLAPLTDLPGVPDLEHRRVGRSRPGPWRDQRPGARR